MGLTLQHLSKHEENGFRFKVSRLLLVDLVNDAELLRWVPAKRTGGGVNIKLHCNKFSYNEYKYCVKKESLTILCNLSPVRTLN